MRSSVEEAKLLLAQWKDDGARILLGLIHPASEVSLAAITRLARIQGEDVFFVLEGGGTMTVCLSEGCTFEFTAPGDSSSVRPVSFGSPDKYEVALLIRFPSSLFVSLAKIAAP